MGDTVGTTPSSSLALAPAYAVALASSSTSGGSGTGAGANSAPMVPTATTSISAPGPAGTKMQQQQQQQPQQPSSPSQYVKLNVGGSLHYTTIGTLTKLDSMLRAMFSGRMEVLTDSEGWILIDRSGKHFGTVLSYLRDGSVSLPDSPREIAELYVEAKYYLISGLMETCETALRKQPMVEAICRVPLITSDKECQQLLQATQKPVVKLLINRHNNKYSYTSASDDNLLKNLEMFDRLSLRFSSRIVFIKDVIGTNEICCWSFYGHGKKVAEFCCTSIVYATDKKHTKVEFPEARIYEEVLNILLYENRQQPDPELMQATSQRGAGLQRSAAAVSDDEDIELKQQQQHHQQQAQPVLDAPAGPSRREGGGSSSALSRFRSGKSASAGNSGPN